jgi:hypothetical protein
MDNIFTIQLPLAELRRMGIEAYGTCWQQFRGVPKEQQVGKNAKLTYHCEVELLMMGLQP